MENYDGFLDNKLPALLLCNSLYQGLMQNASVRLNAHLEISNSLRSIFDCIVHMLFDKLGELYGSQHYLLNARRYYRDNISDIDNIEKLKLKDFKNFKPVDFKNQVGIHRDGYDADNLENIDIISGGSFQQSGGFIKIIQNIKLIVKISECQLFSVGNSEKID